MRHLTLRKDFVARECIRLGVVSGASVGVSSALEVVVVIVVLVLVHVANISVRHITAQTGLLILNFFRSEGIVVVFRRVLNKSLVKHGLKEDVEVTHPPSMVTILVLRVDSEQAVPSLALGGVLSRLRSETESSLNSTETGQ